MFLLFFFPFEWELGILKRSNVILNRPFIQLSFIKIHGNWSCYPLFRACFLTNAENRKRKCINKT